MSEVVGYASGVFDLFHIGHLNILKSASENCDRLIVGVASDEYIENLKGNAPVIPFEERAEIVANLKFVDKVVKDESVDKTLVWCEHPFHVFFKGDDWRGSPKGNQLEADMARVGVRVHYFPYTLHTSSTRLRTYLENAEAAASV
jgi:glycerol-3-phosphate cytidylyltransferase